MKTCECSQCGVSAQSLTWGFALLAREGWGVAPATVPVPAGAAERAWLCSHCESRAKILARGLERLAAPRPLQERQQKRLKVLIVDDHLLMLRSMVRMLAGCDTVVTTNPAQALAVLCSGAKFDAIVSDVMMPEMSGPELYARCFKHSPELARRFVFASADPIAARYMVAQVAARVGAGHAPPVLTKPTSRALLMSAVSTAAEANLPGSGTYFMQFPRELGSQGSEAKGHRVASRPSTPNNRRSSGGIG